MKKKKILVLSDHPLSPSGVGTQTKYFIEALLNGDSVPIPIEEILEVTRVSIELAENN